MQRGKSTSDLFTEDEIYQPKKMTMQTLSVGPPKPLHFKEAKELVAVKATELPHYLTSASSPPSNDFVLGNIKVDLEKLT